MTKPLKYNPYTGKFEPAEEDYTLRSNIIENTYEYGTGKYSYGIALNKFSNKGSKLVEKFNPYTNKFELVPEDWELSSDFDGSVRYMPKKR